MTKGKLVQVKLSNSKIGVKKLKVYTPIYRESCRGLNNRLKIQFKYTSLIMDCKLILSKKSSQVFSN